VLAFLSRVVEQALGLKQLRSGHALAGVILHHGMDQADGGGVDPEASSVSGPMSRIHTVCPSEHMSQAVPTGRLGPLPSSSPKASILGPCTSCPLPLRGQHIRDHHRHPKVGELHRAFVLFSGKD